jgi:hypothetical protein
LMHRFFGDRGGSIYLYPRLVFDNGTTETFETANCEAMEQRDLSGARVEPERENFMYSVTSAYPTVEGRIHIWHPVKRDCGQGLRYTRYRLQLIGGVHTATGTVEIKFQTKFSKIFGHHVRPHARTSYHSLTDVDIGDFAWPTASVDYPLAEFIKNINGVVAAESVNPSRELRPDGAVLRAVESKKVTEFPVQRRFSMSDDFAPSADMFPTTHSLDMLAAATVSNAAVDEDGSDSEPLARTLTESIKMLTGKRSRAEMECGSVTLGSPTLAVRQRYGVENPIDVFMKQKRPEEKIEMKQIVDGCMTTSVPQPTVNTLILILLHSIMKSTPGFVLDDPARAAIERLTVEDPAIAPVVASVIPQQQHHIREQPLPSPSLSCADASLVPQLTAHSLDATGAEDLTGRTPSVSQYFGCAASPVPSSSPHPQYSPNKLGLFKGLEPYRRMSS